MTDETTKNPPHQGEQMHDEDESLFERVVPDGVKRRLEAGMDAMLREGRFKKVVGEMKLPKEMVNYIMSQMDETKHAALSVVAKEMRQFLEKTNLAEELANVLTKVSFEVNTQVRFVPNDRAPKRGEKVKMEVQGPSFKPVKVSEADEGPSGEDVVDTDNVEEPPIDDESTG